MEQLVCKEIAKVFTIDTRQLVVLKDITFSVKKGELLAIVGASGSGKSTLLNILGCLDVPTKGQYFIDSQNVANLSLDERAHLRNKKMGFVFQQFNLISELMALDNVALPLLYAGVSSAQAKKRAQKILEQVGLGDRLNHFPQQLSGGEQQRVAIARAFVNEPEVILADEPTGNIDSVTGKIIMNLLQELNQTKKVTIIIVTHDREIAMQTNRIITLKDGQIISDKKI